MMLIPDRAIPILPAISLEKTIAFYRQIGFDCEIVSPTNDYAVASRETLEIHFFLHVDLNPSESAFGCYFRVNNVSAFFDECSRLNLPSSGIPRISSLEDRPWGMREFTIIDENGSLIRIGQEL